MEGFTITHYNPYRGKESTWVMYIDDAGKMMGGSAMRGDDARFMYKKNL